MQWSVGLITTVGWFDNDGREVAVQEPISWVLISKVLNYT